MFREQRLRRGILLISLLVSIGTSQRSRLLPADTLANVGGAVITATDLVERIELMPWPEKQKQSRMDSAKVKALQSLVAEKVLALEGYKLEIDREPVVHSLTDALEKLLIRDELYRREVSDKTKMSQQEIVTGAKRFGRERGVMVIRADSRKRAESLYRELSKAKDLLKALKSVSPGPTEVDSITVGYGGQDVSMENGAFALQKGKLSQPVRSEEGGWMLLYLTGERLNPDYKSPGAENRLRRVEQVIRDRKENESAARLFRDIFSKKTARANSELFPAVAETLLNAMIRDSASLRIKSGFLLSPAAIDESIALLGPLGKKPLLEMEGGDLSAAEVLEMMKLDKFDVPILDLESFKMALNRFAKRIAEEEFLTREGKRLNLQNSRRVQHDLGVWSEHWVSQLLLRRLRDSVKVTDDDIRGYFVEYGAVLGKWYEVNVREVLSENLSAASAALEELQQGRKLEDVARERSIRKEWASRGGESGYFAGSQHPELLFYAFEADTGKLIGPVKLPEGYSFFTVLGKRRTDSLSTTMFDTMKTNVRNRLRIERQSETVDSFISGSAKELKVRFHYEHLRSVPVTPTNMVTSRRMGFGGEINAVPALVPQWNWSRKMQPATLEMP